MSPKHTNPSYDKPRRDSKTQLPIWACAPYNFVRLPEKVVLVDPPPDQDIYTGYTGYIDCEMETLSPVYIRGMATPEMVKKRAELDAVAEARSRSGQRLSPQEREARDEKERQLKELKAPFFNLNGQPIIPGSSLRGLIRSIVEIISYSKIRWVGTEPTFSFRAVADPGNDPLKEMYKQIIGNNASHVRAGYLVQRGEDWAIQPAMVPSDLGLLGGGTYLKVKEWILKTANLPGYRDFSDSDYRPGYYEVSFETEVTTDKNGKSFTAITLIGPRSVAFTNKGVLVCSGNMRETNHQGQEALRKNHALVLEASAKSELLIDHQAVIDYQRSLSVFQRENLRAWNDNGERGCLKDGAPVFYVQPRCGEKVVYIGHNPNLRIPMRFPGMDHASNPLDFVPLELRTEGLVDFADAIFGWTPEPGGNRKESCAGRVFFSDAFLRTPGLDIWYKPEPITPHVLSGPKATTFQHYLVQDKDLGHHPDSKSGLAHYGTLHTDTQIRGRKYYWHKGSKPDIEATDKEREHESQLTRIKPLRKGVRFGFHVYFENLRPDELGAVVWALRPRGKSDETFIHKIGMGKPLGMGAVYIDRVEINLTNRSGTRYEHLFEESGTLDWCKGIESPKVDFEAVFQQTMLAKTLDIYPDATALTDLEPVKELLTMMAWLGDDPGQDWQNWSRYMEIEHGESSLNEYKERPVLPTPTKVLEWANIRPVAPEISIWPPPAGEIMKGKARAVDENGNLRFEILSAQNPSINHWLTENSGGVELKCIINQENLGGRVYRDGAKVKLVVLASQQELRGWLIICRPEKLE